MKNIKVEMAPPYNSDKENYVSKVTMSIEFDNELSALNFIRNLNLLILEFGEGKVNG